MSGEITSTGELGQDYYRSEGRAYYSVERVIHSVEELRSVFENFDQTAQEKGRRRTVVRAICTREVLNQISLAELPLEVAFPLNLVDAKNEHCLIMLGKNVHDSPVPEWPNVYDYWRSPNGTQRTPLERVCALNRDAYTLTDSLTPKDSECLYKIWAPFGWTQAGVREFITHYNQGNRGWFAGVRNTQTRELLSACMGEQLRLPEVLLVEGTEYGTQPGYEGNGFCTASVTALHAQILRDSLYTTGETPLITAEFDLSSRSDIPGRHAGMEIPLLGSHQEREVPIQVLRHNVAVLDRQEINSLNWRDLGVARHHYQDAYRTKYRFWRNFVLGVLPLSSIATHYSHENVIEILNHIER